MAKSSTYKKVMKKKKKIKNISTNLKSFLFKSLFSFFDLHFLILSALVIGPSDFGQLFLIA